MQGKNSTKNILEQLKIRIAGGLGFEYKLRYHSLYLNFILRSIIESLG